MRGRYAVLKSLVDISTLERIIGAPVYLSGPHRSTVDFTSQEAFGRYNPVFLNKLQDHLQAVSQSTALTNALQPLYDKEFRTLLRAFFETYEAGTGDTE
ncbi:hypothetical protein RZS08_67270, partial [Arthrospira platensis SPKY1]|nr:hypothetical protein [Arthrospira platensis SPKY1]